MMRRDLTRQEHLLSADNTARSSRDAFESGAQVPDMRLAMLSADNIVPRRFSPKGLSKMTQRSNGGRIR